MIPGSGAGRGTSIQGAVYSKKWQEGGGGVAEEGAFRMSGLGM